MTPSEFNQLKIRSVVTKVNSFGSEIECEVLSIYPKDKMVYVRSGPTNFITGRAVCYLFDFLHIHEIKFTGKRISWLKSKWRNYWWR